jgi:hypothetical protein
MVGIVNSDFKIATEKDNNSVYNLDTAFNVVRERFTSVDIKQQCQRSGAAYSLDTITLKYLDCDYKIDISSVQVSPVKSSQPISLREKILILHYFTQAKGTPASGKLIAYRDLPGGLVYYPTFTKRTIKPLINSFGKNPDLLISAGKVFNAKQGDIGDVSLVIDVFARVPVTCVLWLGDNELNPEMNLLFDANITDYLASEDVTIVCENIVWRLIDYAKKV